VSVVTRINNGGQGASNAWSVGIPADSSFEFETVVGNPVALTVSDKDVVKFNESGRWSDLTQRLVRVSAGQTSTSTENAKSLIAQIIDDLTLDSTSGSQYAGGRYVATVKTTNVVSAPAPVAPAPVATASVSTSETVAPAMNAGVRNEFVGNYEWFYPTASDVGTYVERVIDGVRETVFYDQARATQQSVALVGDAGTGKTSSAEHYAMLRNLPFLQFDCNSMLTLTDVEGSMIPVGDNWAWADSPLILAIQRPSVLLLNESNRLTPRQQAMFFTLLAERAMTVKGNGGKRITVHPDCLIITDFNDGVGYTGASAHDTAFRDRFDMCVRFTYDRAIESQFIKSATLQKVAWQVRNDRALFKTPFSTRLLKRFESWALNADLGIDFAIGRACESFADRTERDALKQLFVAERDNIKRELNIA
jgi:nitric oxide reductase NorQ protein